MLAAYKIKIDRVVLMLVALKNVIQPTLVLGGLLWLGYGAPIRAEAVLTSAIPTMPIVIVLAVQYHVFESRSSSALFLQCDRFDLHYGGFHRTNALAHVHPQEYAS